MLLAATSLSVACLPARAQRAKPTEYDVKAVYLYNFGRFVDWPPATVTGDSFTICVLGQDPFGSVLDATIAGETIDNKKLVAKRIAGTADATDCQILFVSLSEAAHLKDTLAAVNKPGLLTVSDLPGFTSGGGMIQFVLIDDKVRFEVNLSAAQRGGLTFSSQLLKVASAIRQDPAKDAGKP